MDSDAMYAKLRNVLETTSYDDVKVRAIRNLAHFKDKQAVPLLINELKTPGVVRAQAASALAAIGSPDAEAAKPALLGALPTADEKDRSQIVWALAVLKEPNAADDILKEFSPRITDAGAFAERTRVLLVTASNGIDIDVALGWTPFEANMLARASIHQFTRHEGAARA